MKVPFNYLNHQFNNKKKYFKEWSKLINSSEFTLGPFVKEFEKKFANYIGVKHCISTNNGTDALILSLKSLGIGKGDEVITVSNSFYATAGAISACGAKIITFIFYFLAGVLEIKTQLGRSLTRRRQLRRPSTIG